MARIAVVGTGYVGLGTGAVFASRGHDVVGIDIDASKVARLEAGECPIFEPGLPELLAEGRAAGRLRFTTAYASAIPEADAVFICVGTPMGEDGSADLRYVREAARRIGRHLAPGRATVVVTKSTMPVGTSDRVARLLAASAPAGAGVAVVSNPEFLREGTAVADMLHPDRVVLGGREDWALDRIAALYDGFGAPVVRTDPPTAELIKYASNAFLATKISFINEMARVCEATGADVRRVAEGMGLDERIGARFLGAGLGWGGSCFGKDVRALAHLIEERGGHPQLLGAVIDANRRSRAWAIRTVERLLGDLEGRTVAVWGLAFKPDTDDLRDAPALDICRGLLARGATVRAHDPAAMAGAAQLLPGVVCCPDPYDAATGADALLVLTEWSDFCSADLPRTRAAMRGTLLVDGRNAIDPVAAATAGLDHHGVGTPARPRAVADMSAERSATVPGAALPFEQPQAAAPNHGTAPVPTVPSPWAESVPATPGFLAVPLPQHGAVPHTAHADTATAVTRAEWADAAVAGTGTPSPQFLRLPERPDGRPAHPVPGMAFLPPHTDERAGRDAAAPQPSSPPLPTPVSLPVSGSGTPSDPERLG